MKKIFAILMAAMLVMALSVSAFAAETVVFDNPEGEVPTSCEDPWGSFGVVGDVWGRGYCCDISLADLVALFDEGGYSFTYVYSGSGSWEGNAPHAVINADWDNAVDFTYTDLGDGKFEATIALADILSGYGIASSDIETFCVQNWTTDFKLYSAKFTNEASAPAATPEPSAPAADPEPSAPAATPADTTPAPSTGLALAVVPAVVALAAVAVSKKH